MGKNIGKNKIKNVSRKYSQKPLHHTKQYAADASKTTSEGIIQKTVEVTGYLIANNNGNGITKLSRNSPQNNSGEVSKFGVFSCLYFPVFGLNVEIYSVNLRNQSKYRKRRIRRNSAFGHFSRSELQMNMIKKYLKEDIYF